MLAFSRRSLFFGAMLACLVGCTGGDASKPDGKSGGGSTKPAAGMKRIIFLTNGDDPFWDTCNAGLMEGAKEFNAEAAGFTVVMDKGNFKAEGQLDKLRQYATESDIAAVAISVVQADNKAIVDEMLALQKKGIKIITVDGDVNREKFREARTYYIGTDNVTAGKTLGTATKAILEGKKVDKGTYFQFAGFTDNDNARSRMNGVEEAIGSAYKQADRRADKGDRNVARDNVRTALDNGGEETVALIGIWAYNAPAIADVVEERKIRDKVTVAAFDAASDAIKSMSDGGIDVMCVQNPFDMGRQSVKLLMAMCQDDQDVIKEMFPKTGEPDGDIFTTGLRIVVPDDKSPAKADLFDPKNVEFMTLEKFKEWLAKYELKSS